MSQIIYSILGLSIAVLFATSLNRSVHTGEQGIVSNEVLTQMLGVGQDVLEDVGRRALPFDSKTDESTLPTPIDYPVVHSAAELTPALSFGGCTSFTSCGDLDDFHGMPSFQRVSNGITYDVTIEVRYVQEANPELAAAAQTFAKEVNVLVSSQSIQVGNNPLTVGYSRVFTYDKATDFTPGAP